MRRFRSIKTTHQSLREYTSSSYVTRIETTTRLKSLYKPTNWSHRHFSEINHNRFDSINNTKRLFSSNSNNKQASQIQHEVKKIKGQKTKKTQKKAESEEDNNNNNKKNQENKTKKNRLPLAEFLDSIQDIENNKGNFNNVYEDNPRRTMNYQLYEAGFHKFLNPDGSLNQEAVNELSVDEFLNLDKQMSKIVDDALFTDMPQRTRDRINNEMSRAAARLEHLDSIGEEPDPKREENWGWMNHFFAHEYEKHARGMVDTSDRHRRGEFKYSEDIPTRRFEPLSEKVDDFIRNAEKKELERSAREQQFPKSYESHKGTFESTDKTTDDHLQTALKAASNIDETSLGDKKINEDDARQMLRQAVERERRKSGSGSRSEQDPQVKEAIARKRAVKEKIETDDISPREKRRLIKQQTQLDREKERQKAQRSKGNERDEMMSRLGLSPEDLKRVEETSTELSGAYKSKSKPSREVDESGMTAMERSVAAEVQQKVQDLLEELEIEHPLLAGVIVHFVRVSADLRYADVYWAHGNSLSDYELKMVERIIEDAHPHIAHELGNWLKRKHTPRLRFYRVPEDGKSATMKMFKGLGFKKDDERVLPSKNKKGKKTKNNKKKRS